MRNKDTQDLSVEEIRFLLVDRRGVAEYPIGTFLPDWTSDTVCR